MINYREKVVILCESCGNERTTTKHKMLKGNSKCPYCKALNRQGKEPMITNTYKLYYVKIGAIYKIGITRYANVKNRFNGVINQLVILGVWVGEEEDIIATEKALLKNKDIGIDQKDSPLYMYRGYTEMRYNPILDDKDLHLLSINLSKLKE